MTVPLPGGKADELLRHAGDCPTCRGAKSKRRGSADFCPTGKRLIRETTEERFPTK